MKVIKYLFFLAFSIYIISGDITHKNIFNKSDHQDHSNRIRKYSSSTFLTENDARERRKLYRVNKEDSELIRSWYKFDDGNFSQIVSKKGKVYYSIFGKLLTITVTVID